MNPLPELPAGAFTKQDTGDDLAFYAPPRLVTHIDEGAVASLTAHYRGLLPEDKPVLDLMSSWVSHLPPDRTYAPVVGHGMNAEELAANPRLDRWFVQDLNRDATLPLDDRSFEGALCCVGAHIFSSRLLYSPKCAGYWCRKPRSSSASQIGVSQQRQLPSGGRSTSPDTPRWSGSTLSAQGSAT